MASTETLFSKTVLSYSLWRQNHDLVAQTLRIPFVINLYEGSLPTRKIEEYYQQDNYFRHIVRPFRTFIKSQSDQQFDPGTSREILRTQIESAPELNIVPSKVTSEYIGFFLKNSDYLLKAATALLPCSKLYNFLVKYLSRINPSEMCINWIGQHNYPNYQSNTNVLESLVNKFGDKNIKQLSAIYRDGLKHEIAFFSQFD